MSSGAEKWRTELWRRERSSAAESNPPPDERDSGCLCQRCGFRYKVDFTVSDETWLKIANGFNLLCGLCIVRQMEALGQFDYFDLVKPDEGAIADE